LGADESTATSGVGRLLVDMKLFALSLIAILSACIDPPAERDGADVHVLAAENYGNCLTYCSGPPYQQICVPVCLEAEGPKIPGDPPRVNEPVCGDGICEAAFEVNPETAYSCPFDCDAVRLEIHGVYLGKTKVIGVDERGIHFTREGMETQLAREGW
jgi:hypothetical protein